MNRPIWNADIFPAFPANPSPARLNDDGAAHERARQALERVFADIRVATASRSAFSSNRMSGGLTASLALIAYQLSKLPAMAKDGDKTTAVSGQAEAAFELQLIPRLHGDGSSKTIAIEVPDVEVADQSVTKDTSNQPVALGTTFTLKTARLADQSLETSTQTSLVAAAAASNDLTTGTVLSSHIPGGAGPELESFNINLAQLLTNVREVQGLVGNAVELAEFVEDLLDTFDTISQAADKIADLIGGMQNALRLLEKVPPLKTVAKILRDVLDDMRGLALDVRDKAKEIDDDIEMSGAKDNAAAARAKLEDLEQGISDAGDELEDYQSSALALEFALDIIGNQTLSDSVELVVDGPNSVVAAFNAAYADARSQVVGFNTSINVAAFDVALQMQSSLANITGSLGFLEKPLDILEAAIKPVKWALDAADFIFDKVVSKVLDPLLDSLGINALFDKLTDGLKKLLPDPLDLNGPQDAINEAIDALLPGGLLPEFGLVDLETAVLDFINHPDLTSSSDLMLGTKDDDVVTGDSGDNILSGGDGNDILDGVSGADTFIGGRGDDRIIGQGTDDLVVLSGILPEYVFEFSDDATTARFTHARPVDPSRNDGTDTITNVENYRFSDGLQLTASVLANNVYVSDGTGAPANPNPLEPDDLLAETDDYLFANFAAVSMIISGGLGNDQLVGGSAGDTLNGGAGNDVLNSGTDGIDTLNGGADDDTAVFTDRTDGQVRVDLGDIAGDPRPTAFTATATLINVENIIGSTFGDWIYGSDNATGIEELSGEAGDDILRGYGGDDRIDGGDGNDIIIGGTGNNQVLGGRGDDWFLVGESTDETVDGGPGFDFVDYDGTPDDSFVISTFDTDAEGWTLLGASGGHHTANGNTGGSLRGTDNAGGSWMFVASIDFHGDHSDKLDGTLSFDYYHELPRVDEPNNDIIIVGNGEAIFRAIDDPGRGWRNYEIDLVENSGWFYTTDLTDLTNPSAGAAWVTQEGTFETLASRADISSVLSDITAIHIRGDYSGGADSSLIDNVMLTDAPADEINRPQVEPTIVEELFNSSDPEILNEWQQVNFDGFNLVAGETDPVVFSFGGIAGQDFGTPGFIWYFEAPDRFLGDRSDLYGGGLEFFLRDISVAGDIISGNDVILTGAGTTLTVDIGSPIPGEKTEFQLGLHAGAGWRNAISGLDATEAEFRTVLGSLDGVYFRGELRNGADQSVLDDITFQGPPTLSPLYGADDILGIDPVAGTNHWLTINGATGIIERRSPSDVLLSTDTLIDVEGVGASSKGDIVNGALADENGLLRVHGNAGADLFRDGLGTQEFFGEGGNDVFIITERVSTGGDIFHGGDGQDTLDLRGVTDTRWRITSAESFDGRLQSAERNAEDSVLFNGPQSATFGFETIHTGDFDDQIVTDARFIHSYAGNDRIILQDQPLGQNIFAGDGDDEVYSFWFQPRFIDGGDGNDLIEAIGGIVPANEQTVLGGAGDDRIITTIGYVNVDGGDGSDTLEFEGDFVGSSGQPISIDLLTGNFGGGAAFITIANVENVTGTTSDDVIRGDHLANILVGGQGMDLLVGRGTGTSAQALEDAKDTLFGNEDDDELVGGIGDDVLHGGAGNDMLKGGAGIDTASYIFFQEGTRGTERYDAKIVGKVDVDLATAAPVTATFTPMLAYENFEFSVSGWTVSPNGVLPDNFSTTDAAFTQFLHIADNFGAGPTQVDRSFDFEFYTGDITIAFDLYEIDDWNNDTFTVELGALGQVFSETFDNTNTAAPEAARNGLWAGGTWSITPVSTGHSNIGIGATADNIHRIEITATLAAPTFDLSLILDSDAGVAGIDNLEVTGSSANEVDTLTGIENIVGGALGDVILGDSNDNSLSGGRGDDELRGRGGNDIILDGDGADYVHAGNGDDRVLVGEGSSEQFPRGDTYIGGNDFDTLDYSGLGQAITVDTTSSQIDKSYTIEIPVWADTMTTEARSVAGSNLTPRDLLEAIDQRESNSADDFERPTSPGLIALSPLMVTVTDTVTGFEAFVGTVFDDNFFGTSAIDDFDGDAGNDRLVGRGGNDILDGDVGEDLLIGGGGSDSMFGRGGDDILRGGASGDTLDGGGGSDTADYTGASARVVADLLNAGINTGDAAGDSYSSIENLEGTDHNDSLRGTSGANRISGGADDDVLLGRAGDDTLLGGEGGDTLNGGGGTDWASYADAASGVTADLFNPADQYRRSRRRYLCRHREPGRQRLQ